MCQGALSLPSEAGPYFCCSALRCQRCVSHNSCLFRFQARQEAGKRGGKLASPTRKRVQPAHQPTNLETSCIIFSGINEASYSIYLFYLCVWLIDCQTCTCINTHEYRTKLGMTKVVLRGSWGCHCCKADRGPP